MIHEGQCGVYKSFTTAMSRNGLYDYMILHDWIKQVFFFLIVSFSVSDQSGQV